MKFTVFSHVPHFCKEGSIGAYPPYVREMNIWLNFVDEFEVVAPVENNPHINHELYCHPNITLTALPAFNLLSFNSAVHFALKAPRLLFKIFQSMKKADHIHIRCPGNIGLLACLVQILFPLKKKTAKYAGNWDKNSKQPWSYRLQKWILKNQLLTKNMSVLVYGEWPRQGKNIKSFFTASFSANDKGLVKRKNFSERLLFVFTGNLVSGKNPFLAIQIVEYLFQKGVDCKLNFIGDGSERDRLIAYSQKNNLENIVSFEGIKTLTQLKYEYQRAHFAILPSYSEGWPKAIAEAMFFGCIPIVTPISCVPWMLGAGNRGVLLEKLPKRSDLNFWIERNGDKILNLLQHEKEIQKKSMAAKEWSQQYTLEKFESSIEELI